MMLPMRAEPFRRTENSFGIGLETFGRDGSRRANYFSREFFREVAE